MSPGDLELGAHLPAGSLPPLSPLLYAENYKSNDILKNYFCSHSLKILIII